MITSGSSTFYCAGCGCEIDLDQYRRKVPRCDECEVIEAMLSLENEVKTARSGR